MESRVKKNVRTVWKGVVSRESAFALVILSGLALFCGAAWAGDAGWVSQTEPTGFSSAVDFQPQECTFKTKGDENNWFFPLIPGYRFVLEGVDDAGIALRKVTTVTRKTERFNIPGLGKFKTRVVEEWDYEDGVHVQVTRFWYAICKETNAVYLFGGDNWHIDPETGEPGPVELVWRAGEPDTNGIAEPGLIMPGTFILGAKYLYQAAEGSLVGGIEHVESGLTLTTKAGTFSPCCRTLETGVFDPEDNAEKYWCAGTGLVLESDGELTEIYDPRGDDDDDRRRKRRRHRHPRDDDDD